MSKLTVDQEVAIIDALLENPEFEDDLLVALRKAKTGKKKAFLKKDFSDVSLMTNVRNVANAALLDDILVVVPGKRPKPPKKTAAEIRKEKREAAFAKFSRMTAKEKAANQALIDDALAKKKRRDAGIAQAKATRKAKAAAAEIRKAAAEVEKKN